MRVRLLGVGVSNLVEGVTARQLSLDADPRWEDVERVGDAVAARFEGARLQPAVLLDEDDDPLAPTADDRRT